MRLERRCQSQPETTTLCLIHFWRTSIACAIGEFSNRKAAFQTKSSTFESDKVQFFLLSNACRSNG